ncbi:hypothetical protein O0L34_g15803 [Tuta absoluta]|nr:hypothetical protein O0L34_g15803 [Tuta absoluta]
MQPSARIKIEGFNETLCQVCLSSDRKINVLGELDKVFRQICFDVAWNVSSDIFICWECRSILQKTKKFQEKVAKARIALNGYVEGENHHFTTLSNLVVTKPLVLYIDGTKETYDEKFIIDTPFEVNKIEPSQDVQTKISEPKIKEEIETEYNEDFDNFEFEPMDIVKDENLPDTLKELSGITTKKIKLDKFDNSETIPRSTFKRTLRYKMIRDKDIIKNGFVKVAIPEKDVDFWKEKEKTSKYYRNLKQKCEKCLSSIGTDCYKNHYRKFHVQKHDSHECHICQRWLPSDRLKAHIEKHCVYYLCRVCKYSCYTIAHMREHLRVKHTRVVQCLECDATFTSTREFFPHYKAYHTVFICDVCSKKYKSKESIVKHIKKHHKIYKCEECDITFANYRCHYEHVNMKHKIERSEASYCVQCNMQFDTIYKYKKHISTAVVHLREMNKVPKKTPVKCPDCPNVYTRKVYMVNHYRAVHSKNYRFYCNICQKGLLNSTRYKQHMAYIHEGREKEKNKICYICGRGFNTNRILENHMRTHTGERPYGCAHCEAKFAQKTALDTHVKFIHMKHKRKPADDMKKIIDSFGTELLANKHH